MSVSEHDSFCHVLFDEVVPAPIDGLQVLSYIELFNKTAREPIRFAKEIAQHITGAATPYEAPFEESFVIMNLIPWFCGSSRIVVANAFGDEDTAKSILSKLAQQMK